MLVEFSLLRVGISELPKHIAPYGHNLIGLVQTELGPQGRVEQGATFLRGLLGVRGGLLLQGGVVGHCRELVLVELLEGGDRLVDRPDGGGALDLQGSQTPDSSPFEIGAAWRLGEAVGLLMDQLRGNEREVSAVVDQGLYPTLGVVVPLDNQERLGRRG